MGLAWIGLLWIGISCTGLGWFGLGTYKSKKNDEQLEALPRIVPLTFSLSRPPPAYVVVGKTLIAKACAGEAGVPFLYACGSDFNGM